MKKIKISVSKEYEVLIGNKLLDRSGELIRPLCPKSSAAAIISDDNVAPIYMERLTKSLETAGFSVISFVFPHGENSKNAETLVRILDEGRMRKKEIDG